MRRMFGAGSALCLTGALSALVVGMAPADAVGQGRARRAEPAPKTQAAAPGFDLARGAREAPAAVQAAGIRCSVTGGAFIGSSAVQVNGAAATRNAYEVGCSEGLGYIVLVPQAGSAAPVQALDCVTLQTTARADQAAGRTPGPQCRLPANANPAQGLQAIAREAGAACTVTNARAVGRLTSTNSTRYEIACSEGAGYFLDRPDAGGRAALQTCFRGEATSGGQLRCQFTTKAQSLAALRPLVTASGRSCTVSDARIAGVNTTTRNEVIEVGCQGAPGFFIETAASTGAFVAARDCGRLGSEQCQFTAASVAQARNAQDYTQLLRAAGVECTVSNFELQGRDSSGREIVEAACSNRPEGVFGLLAAAGAAGRSEAADCIIAGVRYRRECKLTQAAAVYPAITRSLPSQPIARDCRVNDHRTMGATSQGENWLEIGCENGRSYVIDYRGNGRVARVVACGQATEIFGGCRRSFPGSKPAVGG